MTKSIQVLSGRVVASKGNKTVVVLVERLKTHALYGKSFKSSKKYQVHSDISLSDGDLVQITKVRPISKHKHFKVLKVVGKDIAAIVTAELKQKAAQTIAEVMPVSEEGSKGAEVESEVTLGMVQELPKAEVSKSVKKKIATRQKRAKKEGT